MAGSNRPSSPGGGGFSENPEDLSLERYILSHARRTTPRVSFLPTASGDADGYVERFHAAFATLDCEADHIGLFRRTIVDLREHVLSRDVIYVGGGNCWNMLLLWRAHGLDLILREAWEEGVLLCGLSAGSICWFEQGTTDSFGLPLRPLDNGLGLLPGSHCPHYHSEESRRTSYLDWVQSGALKPGFAMMTVYRFRVPRRLKPLLRCPEFPHIAWSLAIIMRSKHTLNRSSWAENGVGQMFTRSN